MDSHLTSPASAPPTLRPDALSGLLTDFGNCGSTRSDGALAYRATRASHSDSHSSLWIYRIEGCDLSEEAEATIVSFACVPFKAEDAQARGEAWEEADGYAPAASYESGRVFFAGSKAAARRLLNAFETVASESSAFAEAMQDSDEGGFGLEAVVFEWPEGDMAVLALCNVNHSEEREIAVEAALAEAERRFPGALSDMDCRCDCGYTFATHELWQDAVVEDGLPPPIPVLLALHDQSARAREDHQNSHCRTTLLTQALHWRDIGQAASKPSEGATQGKGFRV